MTSPSNKKRVVTDDDLQVLEAHIAYAKTQGDRAAGVVEEFDRATQEFAGVLQELADSKANVEQTQAALGNTANAVPYTNLAAFPVSATATKSAIALDTGAVYAPGGATWGQPIGYLPTKAATDRIRGSIGNLALTELAGKGVADGPQLVDGSRWIPQVIGSAPIDGGTVIQGTDRIWVREIQNQTIDARWFGVAEGANAITLYAALQALRDGWTLVCPTVNLIYSGGRMILNARKRVTIYGNNLKITALANLPDNPQNGGFYIANCQEVDWYDMAYDGRLDSRTSAGVDSAETNIKSGWNVLPDCDGVRLHRLTSIRNMMDGFYVGHGDTTTNSMHSMAISSFPKRTELNDCVSLYNYRQGLSAVGVDGLTVNRGRYAFTGTIKGTAPKAGIDLEAYEPLGYYNDNVRLNGVLMEGNVGNGLVYDNGTRGAIAKGCTTRDNGAAGVSWANAWDCEFLDGHVENNSLISSEKVNTIMRGDRNKMRGTTIISNGVSGLSAPAGFKNREITGNTFENIGTNLSTPNSSGSVSVVGTGDVFDDNTVKDAVIVRGFDQWAVLFDSPGGSVSDNEIINELAGNDAVTGGLYVKRARYADDNEGSGYKPVEGKQIFILTGEYGGFVEQAQRNRDSSNPASARGNTSSTTNGVPDVLPMIHGGRGIVWLASLPQGGTWARGYLIGNLSASAAPTNSIPPLWQCTTAGTAAPAWAATTAVTVGQKRAANNKIYIATVAGTTGSTAPSHSSGTATDGTVTWTYTDVQAVFIPLAVPGGTTLATIPGTPPVMSNAGVPNTTTGTLTHVSNVLSGRTADTLTYKVKATFVPDAATGFTAFAVPAISGYTVSLGACGAAVSNTGIARNWSVGGTGADLLYVTHAVDTAQLSLLMTATYTKTANLS